MTHEALLAVVRMTKADVMEDFILASCNYNRLSKTARLVPG